MKRILTISLSLLFVALTVASCKKEKDPVKSDKTYLIRTVWHTTSETYSYKNEAGSVVYTKKTPAGSHYNFMDDGTLEFTNKQNVTTTGSYKLYKNDSGKFLEITLNGVTETYVLNNVDMHNLSLTSVKAEQTYTQDGVEHTAASLEVSLIFECACSDR